MNACEPVASWFFWFFLVYIINGLANYVVQCRISKTYASFRKPLFAPPSWLFPIAWFLNFLILATSAFLVWYHGGGWGGYTWQLIYFVVHMFLLPVWSVLFWYYQIRFISFLWLLLIIVVAIGNMIIFGFLCLAASLIMIPYILWLIFAALLNYSIFTMNSSGRELSNVSNKMEL